MYMLLCVIWVVCVQFITCVCLCVWVICSVCSCMWVYIALFLSDASVFVYVACACLCVNLCTFIWVRAEVVTTEWQLGPGLVRQLLWGMDMSLQ